MYSEVSQRDRFVWFIKNAPIDSIERIDRLLGYFHVGGKCNWRAKSLRQILMSSEIGMLFALELEKKIKLLDEEGRELFTRETMGLREYCINTIATIQDSREQLACARDELIYAYLDNAEYIKKNNGEEWFFSNPNGHLVQAIRNAYVINYPPGKVGAAEFNSTRWEVRNKARLLSRLKRYGDCMEELEPLDIRMVLGAMIHGINILGGRLAESLYVTDKHPLTSNISGIFNIVDNIIIELKNGHKPIGFITDGRKVSLLVSATNNRTKATREYWTSDKVDTSQCRIFLFKGTKHNRSYKELVGTSDRHKQTELLDSYTQFVRNSYVLSEAS